MKDMNDTFAKEYEALWRMYEKLASLEEFRGDLASNDNHESSMSRHRCDTGSGGETPHLSICVRPQGELLRKHPRCDI